MITIRKANADDMETLAALAVETYVEAFGHSFGPPDLSAHLARYLSPAEFERILAEDTVLVAEAGQQMVGFVQFGRAYEDSGAVCSSREELRRLYVRADYQNQGIGARLIEAALAHPEMRDAEEIVLDVWEHNPGAQRFYARYGFETIGARRFSVESGAATSHDLIMARRRSGGAQLP